MKSLINKNMKKVQKRVADIRAAKEEKSRERQVHFGAQDNMDILSYSGLEEQPNYLIIDGQYVRTLSIPGFPQTAHIGWLDNLINYHGDIDVSLHINSVEATSALPKLHRKVTELESRRRTLEREGRIVGSEITDPLYSAESLRDAILRGQEKLFLVSITATLKAGSLEELNKKSTLLESVLAAHLFFTKDAYWRQIEGLQTTLPRGEDLLGQKRNLDSSSAALTFPFVSSELAHDSGILFGVNISNNSLVIVDRFSLHNANSIMFADSGSGKSYTSKIEILRHLMQGTKTIVIDPEREYEQLAKSQKGTYIKLSLTSKERINPFDLASTNRTREGLSAHIQFLTELISVMVSGSDSKEDRLSNREKAALDKAIVKIYQVVGEEKSPQLEDLYNELKTLEQEELCQSLDRYITGSLGGVFNTQTTDVDLKNRLIVFDIKEMPPTERKVMMMILSSFVQNEVMAQPEKRLLVIDEGWLLLEHEQSAKFIAGLVRRARKYFLGVSFITQQANDFLKNEYGSVIASQSALRILLRQDTTSIKTVANHFNLSDYEKQFLLTSAKGEALIIADNNHVSVRVMASREEHPLITTDPVELYAPPAKD